MNKLIISIGAFVGSTIGGYIPLIWGGSLLSVTSIFLGMIGGILGIVIGYVISKRMGFI